MKIMEPYLEDIEVKTLPGLNELSWKSKNIDLYHNTITEALQKLESIILTTNNVFDDLSTRTK